MKKNVSGQTITGVLVDKSGDAVTTGGSCYVAGDGASMSAGAGSVLFIGGATWRYRPTQAETNFDQIAFEFRGTGAINAGVQVFTSSPQTGDAFAEIQGAESNLASDIAAQNDVSSAQVSGIVQNVFDTYDPPTFAEMSSGHASVAAEIDLNYSGIGSVATLVSGLNDPTASAIADQLWDEIASNHVASGSFGWEVQRHAETSELVSAAASNAALIAGLNDLASADVSNLVSTGFTNYDGPTESSMQSAITSTLAAIAGVPADVLGQVVETNGSITLDEAVRGLMAVVFGATDQQGARFYDPGKNTVRVVVATNDSNNRESVDITAL